MAYTTLSNSGLRIPVGYGEDDLGSIDYYNWNRMANTLLTINTMTDVDTTGLSDGDILVYNDTSSEWEVYTPGFAPDTTTTTTSTTTT